MIIDETLVSQGRNTVQKFKSFDLFKKSNRPHCGLTFLRARRMWILSGFTCLNKIEKKKHTYVCHIRMYTYGRLGVNVINFFSTFYQGFFIFIL